MAHPASRVLAMLEVLQSNHRLTGAELAGRLGVDERTVRRYAGTLLELGIPVTAARGRYGGYRLSPGYKLPPLMLTDDEAVAVVLGLVAAERLGLGTQAPATAAATAKITRILPGALAERLAALRESLGLTLAPRQEHARPATDLLLALAAATRTHRRVDLTYRSGQRPAAPDDEPPITGPTAAGSAAAGAGAAGRGARSDVTGPGAPGETATRPAAIESGAGRPAVSRRVVDPFGLVFHAGRWYLVAHDHRTAETRSFRVDRIVAADVGRETFEPPPGFDAVAHVTRQWAGLPWQWEVEVLIEADVAQIRRRVPATMADLSETADGVLLRTRAQSLTGMAQLLAGLGWPFTVVRPDELRTALTEHAVRLTAYAQRQPPASSPGDRRGRGVA